MVRENRRFSRFEMKDSTLRSSSKIYNHGDAFI